MNKQKLLLNILLIIVLLLPIIAHKLFSQIPGIWQSGGPAGNQTVTVLLVDPDDSQNLYAGTMNNGIYKTTNGGLSWIHANPPLDSSSETKVLKIK